MNKVKSVCVQVETEYATWLFEHHERLQLHGSRIRKDVCITANGVSISRRPWSLSSDNDRSLFDCIASEDVCYN